MKNQILTIATILVSITTLSAQKVKETDVPTEVTSSFQKSFAGSKADEWEKETNGDYEAEFKQNKVEMSATFKADGTLLETEQEIAVSELPKIVTDYIAKMYAGKKVAEAAKITKPDGTMMFEAEVAKKDLLFDDKGNFIK